MLWVYENIFLFFLSVVRKLVKFHSLENLSRTQNLLFAKQFDRRNMKYRDISRWKSSYITFSSIVNSAKIIYLRIRSRSISQFFFSWQFLNHGLLLQEKVDKSLEKRKVKNLLMNALLFHFSIRRKSFRNKYICK